MTRQMIQRSSSDLIACLDVAIRAVQSAGEILRAAWPLRTTGSAALDLAYVAAGRDDAMWYPELSRWDVAAGILMIEEAGERGRCTDYCGNVLARMTSSTVASNGALHTAILERIGEGCHGQS